MSSAFSRPHVLLLAFVVAASGCLTGSKGGDGPSPPGLDASWAELALPYGDDHDHFKYEHHQNLSTRNFHVIGYDPLFSPSTGRTNGGHHCGDAQQVPGGRRIAAVESRYVGGFEVIDITDPTKPKILGELIMRQTRVYDVGVVPDGKHVPLVTTEQLPTLPVAPPLSASDSGIDWVDACGDGRPVPLRSLDAEDPVPRPFSLILVNIENPSSPQIVDQRPIPTNGHSVQSVVIDGRTWILVSVYGTPGGYYQFFELVTTPVGARLNFLSEFRMKGSAPNVQPMTVHDGWIAKHPGNGKTLAYLAGGYDFFIVDLADPRQPKVIGQWTDLYGAPQPWMGAMHSTFPLPELWDGRHYTILGPEFGNQPGEHPSGTEWVLDTTDPTKPFPVGAWTLPHQAQWTGQYMFSNHYLTVMNRTLLTSMYHGGIWAIDLSNISSTFTLFPSVGVFMPDDSSPKPPPSIQRWTPVLQEIILMPDNTLVTFDGASGIYSLRFDDSDPMPAPVPYPLLEPPHI